MGLRPIRGLYGRPTQAPFSHSLFYLQKPGNHYIPYPSHRQEMIHTNLSYQSIQPKTWQSLHTPTQHIARRNIYKYSYHYFIYKNLATVV